MSIPITSTFTERVISVLNKVMTRMKQSISEFVKKDLLIYFDLNIVCEHV